MGVIPSSEKWVTLPLMLTKWIACTLHGQQNTKHTLHICNNELMRSLIPNKKLSWCWQTCATRLQRVWFPINVL